MRMNETAASINTTLERIREAAPRLSRSQVRALTARLHEINEGLARRQSEHQVSPRSLNRNGHGRNNQDLQYTIRQPQGRAVECDEGGSYHAGEPWR